MLMRTGKWSDFFVFIHHYPGWWIHQLGFQLGLLPSLLLCWLTIPSSQITSACSWAKQWADELGVRQSACRAAQLGVIETGSAAFRCQRARRVTWYSRDASPSGSSAPEGERETSASVHSLTHSHYSKLWTCSTVTHCSVTFKSGLAKKKRSVCCSWCDP